MTSSRSASMKIPGSFIPPRDTTKVTQRTVSTNVPKPAPEQAGQPAIDLNRSPTRRSRTPTGYKPGSGSRQPRPSYSDMVSSPRNSGSSTPTVVPATAEKTAERRVAAQPSKKDQLRNLGLGSKGPSVKPTPTSSPIETAIPQAVTLAPPPQAGNFAQELERRLSPIVGKSAESIRPLTLDEEEEQEVATSISVFRSGTGRDRADSTRQSSRDRPTSRYDKDSPSRHRDETSNLIDKIIANHEKLRADMSNQTALFTETLSEQLATQTAVLSATLAENVT